MAASDDSAAKGKRHRPQRFLATAALLISLFAFYGVAQERIMTTDYAHDGAYFRDSGTPFL